MLAFALSLLACLYAACGGVRRCLAKPYKASVPVLCVGNVVAGGSGKTPIALALAQRLQAMGARPHFITRGYGGDEKGPLRVDPRLHGADAVGDEALLLARQAPTWIGRRRDKAAREAAAAGATHLILDDGLQNPQLHQDLPLLVLDGAYGLGNGFVHPAGPLRESLASAKKRAKAVMLVGEDIHGLRQRCAPLPILPVRFETAAEQPVDNNPAIAFCGIGRPEKFFASCAALGFNLSHRIAFPDHHPYSDEEVQQLTALAIAEGARLLTTDKDLVRLPPSLRPLINLITLRAVFSDETALDALLREVL